MMERKGLASDLLLTLYANQDLKLFTLINLSSNTNTDRGEAIIQMKRNHGICVVRRPFKVSMNKMHEK